MMWWRWNGGGGGAGGKAGETTGGKGGEEEVGDTEAEEEEERAKGEEEEEDNEAWEENEGEAGAEGGGGGEGLATDNFAMVVVLVDAGKVDPEVHEGRVPALLLRKGLDPGRQEGMLCAVRAVRVRHQDAAVGPQPPVRHEDDPGAPGEEQEGHREAVVAARDPPVALKVGEGHGGHWRRVLVDALPDPPEERLLGTHFRHPLLL